MIEYLKLEKYHNFIAPELFMVSSFVNLKMQIFEQKLDALK